jgi:hypothetical protein
LCAAGEEALAEAAFRTGEFTGAEKLFGEALALAGQDGDRAAEALAVGGLGMARHYASVALLVGGLVPADADVAAEDELMRRALGIWQEIGDPAGTARALFCVSLVEAVRQLGYSLALREELGDPRRIPSALVALGEAEMAAGNLQRAVELRE